MLSGTQAFLGTSASMVTCSELGCVQCALIWKSVMVASPIRRMMKVILRIALLTCLDGLEPIQSHRNVACNTALVSTILQRTASDFLCRPRTDANNLANIQHEYHARYGTHGSQFDHLKHNNTRRFDATRAGLVSIRGEQSERWMRSCVMSDGSFVRKLHFASRSHRRVPSRWPVEKGQHARFHACRVRP